MHVIRSLRLIMAGCVPGRDGLKNLARPSDFELFPEAERVLKSYGGLRMTGDGGDQIIIEPCQCADLDRVPIKEFSYSIRERAYPIGLFHGGDTGGLIVTERGHAYYTFTGQFIPGGACFEDALWRLLSRNRKSILRRIAQTGMSEWKPSENPASGAV